VICDLICVTCSLHFITLPTSHSMEICLPRGRGGYSAPKATGVCRQKHRKGPRIYRKFLQKLPIFNGHLSTFEVKIRFIDNFLKILPVFMELLITSPGYLHLQPSLRIQTFPQQQLCSHKNIKYWTKQRKQCYFLLRL